MSTVAEIIESLQSQAAEFMEAQNVSVPPYAAIGDAVRQGDLYFVVADPNDVSGYSRPAAPSRKIAFGDTKGSRHEIRDLSTVEVWLPPDYGQDESLNGPFLVANADTYVDHPQHGSVLIPAGLAVHVYYQQNWNVVEQARRRAED